MAGTWTIRVAEAGHAGGVLSCLRQAFEPFERQYTAAAFEDTVLTRATLLERMRTMTVLVAQDEAGTAVGTVAYESLPDATGHIRGMAVLPEWEGRGLAAALLATAEQALAQDGCQLVRLDTTEVLQRAIAFYERHGYRRSGKVGDFFGMPLHEFVKE